MRYTDNIVIVTGAGHGIGRAVANMYASCGAHVVVAERNRDTGEAVAHEINSQTSDGRRLGFHPKYQSAQCVPRIQGSCQNHAPAKTRLYR